jgi:hypothetical protein
MIPTEEEIRRALKRDEFYGQCPERIVVPTGYTGAMEVDGVDVQIDPDADEPYVIPAEGGRLGFDGVEIIGSAR